MVPEIRIIHLDPAVLDRQCLASGIEKESDLKIVGGASDATEALEKIIAVKPDIVLIGCQIEGQSMSCLIRTIRKKYRFAKIVIFSSEFYPARAVDALFSGVSGYLSKRDPVDYVVSSIRLINCGYRVVSSVDRLSEKPFPSGKRQTIISENEISGWKRLLTQSEIKVLQCLAHGMTVSETKKITCKSYSAIKNIRKSAYSKLNVSNAPSAVYVAVNNGILK